MKLRGFVGWGVGTAFVLLGSLPIVACEDDGTTIPELQLPQVSFEAGTTTPPANQPEASTPDVMTAPDAGEPDAEADAGKPPACNDGKVDPGETCDPLSSCPATCPPVQCQLRSLENGGTCTASCKNVAMQTQCINGDGCCPPGCNKINDDDCAAKCDNGVIEGTEKCDPLASCPTQCPAIGCQLRTLTNANTCQAECVNGASITACVNGDSCCPAGCNAANDTDCKPGCGNNVVEPGETCDPLASCPTVCPPDPANKCQLKKLVNAGTCQAACVNDTLQTQCINNDGCCPSGCNANNDNDCKPVCGNGVIESGEKCDPLTSCPTQCPQVACQKYKLEFGNTCQAVCSPDGIQDQCINNDGCCPKGCNANNDNDCKPFCGNGVIESGETCDLPATCPKCGTTFACFEQKGKPATCDVTCNVPITTCNAVQDGCCPYQTATACGPAEDKDCRATKWDFVQGRTIVDTTKGCVNIVVSQLEPDGWYEITTCAPAAIGTGDGDPEIRQINNVQGVPIAGTVDPTKTPDCSEPSAIPRLAGWECKNKAGADVMTCASPNAGGFQPGAGNGSIVVQFCAKGQVVGQPAPPTAGRTPYFIWHNSTKPPQGG